MVRRSTMKPYQKHEQYKRDAQAATYEEWYVSNKGALFDERERDVFVRSIAGITALRAFDLGAGTGRVSEAVAPLVGEMTALDISPVSLGLLDDKGIQRVAPVCADASRLPFRDGTFDLGISCQLVQVMRFDELSAALDEIHRVLVSGGTFVMSTYNLPYWGYRGIVELGDPSETYVRPFTDGFLRYLADKHDLDVVRIGYYKALPFRRLKSRLWLLVDRVLAHVPLVRKKLNQFVIVTLRKR